MGGFILLPMSVFGEGFVPLKIKWLCQNQHENVFVTEVDREHNEDMMDYCVNDLCTDPKFMATMACTSCGSSTSISYSWEEHDLNGKLEEEESGDSEEEDEKLNELLESFRQKQEAVVSNSDKGNTGN